MRVTPEMYVKVSQRRGLFVGYQNCNYSDDYNLNQCKNCQGFNHSIAKCKHLSCKTCAGDDASEECQDKSNFKCINCTHANNYLTKKGILNMKQQT